MRLLALLLFAVAGGGGSAPEHAEIAFVSDGRIWAAKADGSERRQLARGSQPVWSPDGSRLAYVRGERLLVDGRPLTPRRKGVEEASPAWSPDGTALAFTRFTVERNRYRTMIVVRDLASGAERVLVTTNLIPRFDAVSDPAWSPDGATIAYTHSKLDSEADIRPDIRTVPAAGGSPQVLIRDAQAPAWSPDGGRLAFASIRDRNGKVCSSDQCWFPGEIYTAAADGSDLRRLTENEGDDAGPRWSPDGSRILFSSDRNKPAYGSYWPPSDEVYSVAADGSCLTWLTNGTPESNAPAWRPGSGSRFDPGDCDPAARPVRIDPPRLPRTRGLWLGTRFRGLLLADASQWTTTRYLSYADCAAFTGCPPTIELSSGPACRRLTQRSLPRNPRHRFRMRGALVLLDNPLGVAYVLSGPTVTTVRLERRTTLDAVRPIIRRLRPYRASSARKRLAPPRAC